MGLNVASVNAKLNSKVEWTLKEIEKAYVLLDIPAESIQEYFFY